MALVLVASQITLTGLHCIDVSLWGLTAEYRTLMIPETNWRRLTSATDWRRLTHSESKDWLNMKTNRRKTKTLVYCLPFITLGCPNGNTGLTTVGPIATNTGLPTIGCYATNTVGYHARNSTGVVIVSMEPFEHGYLVTTRMLHSNDGLRSSRHSITFICNLRVTWSLWCSRWANEE
jgi:hypothetical protein